MVIIRIKINLFHSIKLIVLLQVLLTLVCAVAPFYHVIYYLISLMHQRDATVLLMKLFDIRRHDDQRVQCHNLAETTQIYLILTITTMHVAQP